MPLRAANWIVSRRLQATQSGGCGFWSGLGTMLRGGICQNWPVQPANGSSTNMRQIASIASSHIARFCVRSTRKPPSSAPELDSPVPKSTRPSEIRSSVATRSATRAGWFTGGGIWTIPWPRRIREVRTAAAGRKTSGAEEWLYSSRKWCSTSQT